jgi:hypothetical protein
LSHNMQNNNYVMYFIYIYIYKYGVNINIWCDIYTISSSCFNIEGYISIYIIITIITCHDCTWLMSPKYLSYDSFIMCLFATCSLPCPPSLQPAQCHIQLHCCWMGGYQPVVQGNLQPWAHWGACQCVPEQRSLELSVRQCLWWASKSDLDKCEGVVSHQEE